LAPGGIRRETAKALDLRILSSLVPRVDEIIE
jgi:hypothetical protein